MSDTDAWLVPVARWIATIDEIAPGVLEGVYAVGSIALADWQPGRSDIDLVAVTTEPADDEVAGILRTALAVHAERQPDARIDAMFLAWGDLTSPPVGVTRPWILDGVFHHDAECFEINPVTWFTLATYGLAVRGPQPIDLRIPLDTAERIRFVRDNAASYWTGVLASLRGALTELAPTDTLPSSVPEWCLLGPCRMHYTAATGDVASKSAAGLWAAEHVGGDTAATIERVVALRSEPERPVDVDVLVATSDAMATVLAAINPRRARG